MFAIEISFQDGVSQPEMILVRRPQALIGATDYAHVAIEDMRELDFQLRLVRDVGNRFHCKPVGVSEGANVPSALEGIYEGAASINLGKVKLFVTALDSDLTMKDSEPPDRAGVRVLRSAALERSPLFPAVVVSGNPPLVVSFAPGQPVFIGRSKQCAVRLDSADISARHARMGYENGEFWIEDLGSTNGTFYDRVQISGRVNIPPGAAVILGRECSIFGVTSEDQIAQVLRYRTDEQAYVASQLDRYPALVSVSEVARPARVVVTPGSALSIGRDPGCDMWLGDPHVSRKHCSVIMTQGGALSVSDHSTNGTAFDGGLLKRGDILEAEGSPHVLDFGGTMTVGICFTREQEETFRATGGALATFLSAREGSDRDTKALRALEVAAAVRQASQDAIDPHHATDSFTWPQRVAIIYHAQGKRGKFLMMLTLFSLIGVLLLIAAVVVGILR